MSTRQNANYMSLIMHEDFNRLKELKTHKKWERSVRFLASGHNDGSMWWDGWYYVLNEKDEPRWCFRRLAVRNFEVSHENRFETVRKYNKNWPEHLMRECLPVLQDQLTKIHLLRNRPPTAATSHLEFSGTTSIHRLVNNETPMNEFSEERLMEAVDRAASSRQQRPKPRKELQKKRRQSARQKKSN